LTLSSKEKTEKRRTAALFVVNCSLLRCFKFPPQGMMPTSAPARRIMKLKFTGFTGPQMGAFLFCFGLY
jgi:hypothetical protein